jgi:anthranilate/para-aminobenzoate synthase component II
MKLSKMSKKGSFYNYSFNVYYLSKFHVPVYGMCFGCQLLNIIYGGTLKDNKKYICEDIDFYEYEPQCPLLKNIPTTNFRYCFSDIVIPSTSKTLNVHVFASIKLNKRIIDCGFEFEKNRVYGTLFHPEYHEDNQIIFYNFYQLCKRFV